MIYLDNNATTQPTSQVVEAMLPYLTKCYFNPSASTAAHTGADRPRRLAAAAMVKLLNAEESECFVFTSGATESNNWVFSSLISHNPTGRVVVSAIEHPSVSEPAAEFARRGGDVVTVPVDDQGVVKLDHLRAALSDVTVLVSIMAASNESGVLQPIEAIGSLIRELCPSAIFHVDGTQAVGKIPIDLQAEWQEVDLVSFSAHKFHGPKGIGGLYVRPGIQMAPMLLGGGQEQGLRSGTSNTPALAGLAIAASEVTDANTCVVRDLRDVFEGQLLQAFPGVVIHGESADRLPNTSYFSLPDVNGEELADLLALRGIIVGTGAACSSGAIHASKTLRAMGVSHEIAVAGVRVSLSRFSIWQELIDLVAQLKAIRETATGVAVAGSITSCRPVSA